MSHYFRLWAVRCFLIYDRPRLRSAMLMLMSVVCTFTRDLHTLASRFTPHTEPLNENRSIVFWGSFFGSGEIFRRPGDFKV